MTIKTIMVPLDGSEPSLRALDFAAGLAAPLGATIELVTVMDMGQLSFFEGMDASLSRDDSWKQKLQQEIIQPALERIQDGSLNVQAQTLQGAVFRTLLKHITESQTDMVVMGRTGRNAMNRILNGSVSQRLSAACPVPVTMVS